MSEMASALGPREHIATVTTDGQDVRLFHIDYPQRGQFREKGVILLIHGFPETSHQYRHVLEPLSNVGYRLIVPDVRGHGASSHPQLGYTKAVLAEDLYHLLQDPSWHRKSHLSHSFATQYASYVKSLIRGECPLPDTTEFEGTKASRKQFHFTFQAQVDLALQLVTGNEKVYLNHFYDKLSYKSCWNTTELYDAFELDAAENRKRLNEYGKCAVPTLGMNIEFSSHAGDMKRMLPEMYETFGCEIVPDSGHYIGEENSDALVAFAIAFLQEHPLV
ncbi:alpha/beta-hydrolase [Mollisia scopiformis]|uniref:Alpha/beta-hydrolase n=1 Tax=Mollisia scopiformis TaxID=149040 RepID=A0A194XKF9_MOLSC|nr:alpha/beta-hydrolase [Mollisia scopiformis]KUJ20594.1 alpha/beta-hydrolase [Mollisia scopiformis]